MRERILKRIAYWHSNYPRRMLIIVIIVTVVLGGFAGQLGVSMRTSDMLPESDERVVEYNRILDEFVTATNMAIVVQGEEKHIKEFADILAPKILALKDSENNGQHRKDIEKLEKKLRKLQGNPNKEPEAAKIKKEIKYLQSRIDLKMFRRIDYKAEVGFLKNHALMLVKEDDLKNLKDTFLDANLTDLITNLNNSMEKEYVGQEESISTREKEDGAFVFLDGIQNLINKLKKISSGGNLSEQEITDAADKILFGEPYVLSYDRTTLMMMCVPNFTILDRDLIETSTLAVQKLVDEELKKFPGVKAGLSGAIAKEYDEQVYSAQSLSYTTIIALVLILILLMISFRMWIAPVLAIGTLIVGLIWAFGLVVLTVGQLNMMTSIMSIILLGLGIDFSIHFISGFTEWRARGDSISDAMEKTFLKSGKGIITGALTTAFAFLALIISEARGMKEMGIVTAVGILSVLLATNFFLPTLLVYRERLIEWKRKKKGISAEPVQKDISFKSLGHSGEWLGKRFGFTLLASIALTAFFVLSGIKISWDHDYKNMEPEGLQSVALMDLVMEKFDLDMNYAFMIADNLDESRKFSEQFRDLSTIALTDDITSYLPSAEQQKKRIPHILDVKQNITSSPVRRSVNKREMRKFIQEIERLEMNIMEMQDMAFLGGQDKIDNKCKEIVGDPDEKNPKNIINDFREVLNGDNSPALSGLSSFQKTFAPYFRESILKMCSTDPIKFEDLPVSILDRYSNNTRDKFLITIYPSASMWTLPNIESFVNDLNRVTERATGWPPLIISMLDIFGRDGRNAMFLTLLVVFFLLWIDFKKPHYALIGMIPLAAGFFWMLGIMNIFGMKLTIINIIGFPMIIGIGIDDGVHVMHRWMNEGKGQLRTVYSSTGKAILLTSLTTMLAFGSLVFSIMPAWVQLGGLLFVGVGACFLTSAFILPGLLGVVDKLKKV